MLQEFRQFFYGRYIRWLDRRLPAMQAVTLDQRRIFIFPSRPGLWFGVLLFIMLLAAINYENNMAFALVFLLTSVFIVTVLHTFANLSGLTLSAAKSQPVFCGDQACIAIHVERSGQQQYFDIHLAWPHSEVVTVSLTDTARQTALLHVPVSQRGWFRPDRLLVESHYPLGLLRAWTWLALDIELLVYPRPLKCPMEYQASVDSVDDGDIVPVVGSDDFYEFKPYQQGDSLKHVFWKAYAKDQDLQTKHYASYREQQLWLNWDWFSGNTEQRLSKLCYWVLQLEKSQDDYGLKLPGIEIEPGHGANHQTRLLTALALYRPARPKL